MSEPEDRIVIRTLAWAAGLAVLVSCSCDGPDPDDSTQAVAERPTPVLYPTVPVPDALRERHDRITRFIERGLLTESAGLLVDLLADLGKAWGPTSERLVPYNYNYLLCLKGTGAIDLALSQCAEALATWPRSFQHQVLHATAAMSASLAGHDVLPDTRESVEWIADPRHHAMLRSLRIEPADVWVQFADLMFRRARLEDCLAALDRAQSIAPDSRHARRLRAECSMAIGRFEDALEILDALVAEESAPRMVLLLAETCARTGRSQRAWELVESALRELSAGGVATAEARDRNTRLRRAGARALNALARPAEARDLLLPLLLSTPEDEESLHLLIASLRAIRIESTASALELRLVELEGFRYERRGEAAARRDGLSTTIAYHEARAWLELDRIPEAIEALRAGIARSPSAADLFLLLAEAQLRLGRLRDTAVRFDRSVRALGSPRIGLALARVLVRLDKIPIAREIVGGIRNNIPPPGDPRRGPVRADLLRTLVTLDGIDAVRDAIAGGDEIDSDFSEGATDIVLLSRAELRLADGDLDEARIILAQRFAQTPGAPSWAGALRAVVDAVSPDAEGASDRASPDPFDPSDLVDQPELARRLRVYSIVARSAPAVARIDRALALASRREAILTRMADFSDSDVLPAWYEIAALCLESGAVRKAREVAWYLWSRDRAGLRENRLLARALSRPENLLERLAALERAAARAPLDEEIARARSEARRALGLVP